MIVVKLSGGIGNQMFQYAFGRNLSKMKGKKVKYDISSLENDNLRKFSLGCFDVNISFANDTEVNTLTENRLLSVMSKIKIKPERLRVFLLFSSYKIIPIKLRKCVTQTKLSFDPMFFKVSNAVYLDGYWQSEKYFHGVENELRKDFKFKSKLIGKDKKIANLIKQKNSVSVHIRRGDYILNESTNNLHGVCSLDYYKSALGVVEKSVKDPYYFIFSDDISWAKDKLNFLKNCFFVEGKNRKDFEDMYLMSLCKNHIIANSSFSWWGAWLSKNKTKLIIAPNKWFNTVYWDSSDVVPENWVKI